MASRYDGLALNQEWLNALDELSLCVTASERLDIIQTYPRVYLKCKLIGAASGTSVETIAAMVATMSPGLSLAKAVQYTEEIVSEIGEGKSGDQLTLYGAFGSDNVRKTEQIFHNGAVEISGQKVTNLFGCIMEPESDEFVVIGKQEKRALTMDWNASDRLLRIDKYEYPYIAAHFRVIAGLRHSVVSELQAVINYVVTRECSKKALVA